LFDQFLQPRLLSEGRFVPDSPVGAAPQQELIAGPKVWDQIRSRKAIVTFYCPNSIKE
jgi:hypothetical protein